MKFGIQKRLSGNDPEAFLVSTNLSSRAIVKDFLLIHCIEPEFIEFRN